MQVPQRHHIAAHTDLANLARGAFLGNRGHRLSSATAAFATAAAAVAITTAAVATAAVATAAVGLGRGGPQQPDVRSANWSTERTDANADATSTPSSVAAATRHCGGHVKGGGVCGSLRTAVKV